ncbi:hypothetical protein GT360_09760 [Vibrio astriarenae]|uniref:Flagellar sheath protein A n=1 Tax=Vibrio astriarenae TaxID=1481923 RepID=A0A7Z2T416_9VIBR|nr:hypothetical protein [Vibrio astriarenae]QIA63788.1 hypothetical protein GT360_09760 [Vibrio astriarenae]
MKKAVVLPIVAALSGALLGCGGGGGGTPPPPAPTKYTFSFIQMEVDKDPDLLSSTCKNPTYFKEYDSGNVDYAKIATTIESVISYDANGEMFKDLTASINSSGTLTFTENDVPDAGFVVVMDNVGSSSSRNYHSLAIQKELLGNYLINVESPQGGNAACYTAGKLSVSDVAKSASLASADGSIAIADYSFETLRNSKITNSASIKREIDIVATSESVLFAGYDASGMINSFAMPKASSLSNDVEGSIPSTVELETLTGFSYVNWTSDSSKSIDSSNVMTYSKDTAFVWQELDLSRTQVNLTDELSYALRNVGEYNGWKVESNKLIASNESFDNELAEAYVYLGNEPEVFCSAAGCSVEGNGVVNTRDENFVRAYIEVGANAKHTIYAIADDRDSVVIPDYEISASYKPEGGENIEFSVIASSDDLNSDFVKLMMFQYHAPLSTEQFVDKVSIVSTPNEAQSNKLDLVKVGYEIIQK